MVSVMVSFWCRRSQTEAKSGDKVGLVELDMRQGAKAPSVLLMVVHRV